MKKFSLLLSLLFATDVYSCEIPLGIYEAIVESEYSLKVKLMESDRFQFIHENWRPENWDIGEKHIYNGTWECNGKTLTLRYTVETIEGGYKTESLKESFGIDKTTQVIYFPKNENTKSLIAGWIFWPQEFIREALK